MRVVVLSLVILIVFAAGSRSQVSVVREGDENPVLTIAKSTFWGGVTGLVLGGAVALVVDNNQDDVVKWFFVGGVFGGFGLGIYHVLTREPPASALLHVDEEGFTLGLPAVTLHRTGARPTTSAEVVLFSWSF